jgi:hypothetical protein
MRAPPLLLFAAACAAAVPASAQQRDRRVYSGFEYYTVSFDSGIGTKTVREMVVPMGAVVQLTSRLTLDAGTYFVSAERTDDAGASTTLSGLTDLIVRAGLQVVPDAVALTLAVNLPTGTATLEGDQIFLAGAVATDLIPFPVTSFGAGMNVTTGVALAQPLGPWALGLAGSFRYNGSYEPVADTNLTLKPGAEYRVRVGVDRLIGQGRFAVGVTYSTFSRDEFGADRFSPGQRLITQASWNLPVGNHTLAFYAWDIHRSVDSSAAFAAARKENTVALGAVGGFRIGRHTLRPSLEMRQQFQGATSLASAGSQYSAGVRLALTAGRFIVAPGVRVDLGTVKDPAGDIGYSGVSAGLSVRAAF